MDQETLHKLDKLCDIDATLINEAFAISVSLGMDAVHSSLDSFKTFLTQSYGNFIPAMNLEYRHYVVGVLKRIDTQYTSESLKAVLFPYGEIMPKPEN